MKFRDIKMTACDINMNYSEKILEPLHLTNCKVAEASELLDFLLFAGTKFKRRKITVWSHSFNTCSLVGVSSNTSHG
jgi:hypothetical protein